MFPDASSLFWPLTIDMLAIIVLLLMHWIEEEKGK